MTADFTRRCCRFLALSTLAAAGAVWAQAEPPPAAAAAAAQMRVDGFRVTGNTLLDMRVINARLDAWKGQRTLDELNQAARDVQRLYAEAGFGGVVAYLPPQTSGDGIVTITVLEGRIAAVTVRGAKTFSDDQVRASVPDLQPGATPRLRRIDAQMQMANENPARHLRVLLKPGQQAGETEAEISVEEAPLQRFTLSLDDTGNDRTGDYRIGATWQHANLSGHDDVLTAMYQTSPTEPGQVAVLSVGYRWPLYRQLTLLDVFAAYSDVDGGSAGTAAGDLRFNGRGRIVGLRASRILPRWGEADQRLAIGLDQREYLNDCAIVGLPPGSCGRAGESVAVQPLSLDYSVQRGGAVAAGATFTLLHNLQLGGSRSDAARFEALRPGAKPRYTLMRLGLAGAFAPAEGWALRGRIATQFSGDALVPGEQMGIGGAASVRGYEEREVVGDSGVLVSAELSTPQLLGAAPDAPPAAASLQAFAFVDAARVRNEEGAPCLDTATRCSLASYGVGLRFERGGLNARLAVARAAKDALSTRSGDTRAHFAIAHTF